jgi:hypothetical protein
MWHAQRNESSKSFKAKRGTGVSRKQTLRRRRQAVTVNENDLENQVSSVLKLCAHWDHVGFGTRSLSEFIIESRLSFLPWVVLSDTKTIYETKHF